MNTGALKTVAQRFAAAGRFVSSSCAVVAIAGCSELELPTPPDMAPLVQAYDEPDGELTTETAVEVGLRVAETVGETRTHSPVELVGEMVTDLQKTSETDPGSDTDPAENEDEADRGQTLLGEKLDVAAIARLHHVCRGWEGKVPPNEALNGSLDLTATVDGEGLVPTVWGKTNACRFKLRNTDLEIDGDLRIRLGSTQYRLNFGELRGLEYLAEFEGRAAIMDDDERSEFDLHTHFRIMPDDKIQLLIALSDGSVVIGVFDISTLSSDEPMLTGGLLTRNARWSCSLNLNNAHGSCTDANDPTSTIDW